MTWVLVISWLISPSHPALTIVEYPTAAICEQAREAVRAGSLRDSTGSQSSETKCVKMPSDPIAQLRKKS